MTNLNELLLTTVFPFISGVGGVADFSRTLETSLYGIVDRPQGEQAPSWEETE